MTYLGIDLGTSSVKVVAVSPTGTVLQVRSVPYATSHPESGAAEQDPDDWWQAVGETVRGLETEIRSQISVIGLSGQMHGTVVLSESRQLLVPAIIWSDVRGAEDSMLLTETLGKPAIADEIGTPLAAGFQAVTLSWLRRTNRATFDSIGYVMLPKDYLRFRLTGELSTEPSDAASTGLLQVHTRDWSDVMLKAVGIERRHLPRIGKSAALSGVLTHEAQAHLGLSRSARVCGGGADVPLAAIASGVTNLGQVMVTLSSGAQATAHVDASSVDFPLRTHTFASALEPDHGECGWYVMGATMACGSALSWFAQSVLGDRSISGQVLSEMASEVAVGADGLIFVPYLSGERTPHMDPGARGAFIGLTADHDRRHMARAIIEGTTFALADALELVVGLTSEPNDIVVAGGGAKSSIWVQVVADIVNRPVRTSPVADQSAVGAAVVAAAADTGRPVSEVGQSWASFGPDVFPHDEQATTYQNLRRVYQAFYPAFASHFPTLRS
jgi:xylulokinase